MYISPTIVNVSYLFYHQFIYYYVKCEGAQNLQPKQKTRSFIQQGDQQAARMKVNLGWVTPKEMQQFSSRIQKLYHYVSSSVRITGSREM